MRPVLIFYFLLTAHCSMANSANLQKKDVLLKPLNEAEDKLEFICVQEKIPAASPDTNILFEYARWLYKNNEIKEEISAYLESEKLYRIAAENNNYKANINLQNGAIRGKFQLTNKEQLRFSQELIDANVGYGYYLIAIYLKNGAAGLKKDEEMSLRYYRKAADEGNPQAQTYVAKKLAPIDIAPDVARKMRSCAAQQGDGDAGLALGINLKNFKEYQAALEAFQMGAAAGNENAAFFLENAFRGPTVDNRLYFINQKADPDRVERYKAIAETLSDWSYANPRIPEINEIIPLPPAELPAWDGKLKWLEEHKANLPPLKPSEELVEKLAKAKMLDPKTGKPLPNSPLYLKQD